MRVTIKTTIVNGNLNINRELTLEFETIVQMEQTIKLLKESGVDLERLSASDE